MLGLGGGGDVVWIFNWSFICNSYRTMTTGFVKSLTGLGSKSQTLTTLYLGS